MPTKRPTIKFYFSAFSLGLILLSLFLLFFLFISIFLCLENQIFIRLLLFTGILLTGFFTIIYLYKFIQIFIWQITGKVAVRLDKEGITTSIKEQHCSSLLWQEIEKIENHGILLASGFYCKLPDLVVCRYLVISPCPHLRQKDELQIETIILKDSLDDVLKTITDYWQGSGEKDQEMIHDLQLSRQKQQRKKLFWLSFFSLSIIFAFIIMCLFK